MKGASLMCPPDKMTAVFACDEGHRYAKEEFTSDNNESTPSLTSFAGEVASQQRSQKVEMDHLQDKLRTLRKDIVKRKKDYQSLSAERLLWDRKIAVCKEDIIQSRSQIDSMKSELLTLIESKQLQENITYVTSCELKDITRDHNLAVERMEVRKDKALQLELNTDLNQRLTRQEEELRKIKGNVAKFRDSSGASLDPSADVSEDCTCLATEKERLTQILDTKRQCIAKEDDLMCRKRIDEEAARKRLAALKLRFTKRIEREGLYAEELKKNYDSLRREVGDIPNCNKIP